MLSLREERAVFVVETVGVMLTYSVARPEGDERTDGVSVTVVVCEETHDVDAASDAEEESLLLPVTLALKESVDAAVPDVETDDDDDTCVENEPLREGDVDALAETLALRHREALALPLPRAERVTEAVIHADVDTDMETV